MRFADRQRCNLSLITHASKEIAEDEASGAKTADQIIEVAV
jgi:hypothetical protein